MKSRRVPAPRSLRRIRPAHLGLGASLLSLALLLMPVGAAAQVSLTISGGASSVHLSNTDKGTGVVGSLRFYISPPVFHVFSVELGSAAARYTRPDGSHDNLLLPEAGLRISLPLAPTLGWFIAGGAGAHVTVRGTNKGSQATGFGAMGLTFHLPGLWALQAEVRARSMSPGHMVDMTIGFTRHFGVVPGAPVG